METFEETVYLFAAQGDGNLTSFSIATNDDGSIRLEDRKRVLLGSKSIQLYSLSDASIFVASDQPTIIQAKNGKLLYSSVFLPEVKHMCLFRQRGVMEDATVVALDTGSDFKICRIDELQKLHVRSISLEGEMAFRIAYQESTKSFGIITMKGGDREMSYLRVLDQHSLEGECLLFMFSCGFI
jgi:DNA damage-binding protein 1